jgi:hypothetical protein
MVGPQVAVLGLDRDREAKPEVQSAGLLEHLATVPVDCVGEAEAELAGMELGLVLDPDRPLDRERQV